MSRVPSRAARTAAVAALLCLPQLLRPAPAQAQVIRKALGGLVEVLKGQLGTAVSRAPEVRTGRPSSLQPCGTLYNPNVRTLVEGPELLRNYAAWLNSSYRVIENSGAPLPVCFEWKSSVVDTNLARTLVHVNNAYIERELKRFVPTNEDERRFWNGYQLTGRADLAEPDTMRDRLARERARSVKTQLNLGPPCRFPVSTDTGETAQEYRRKVTYTFSGAVKNCPR